MKLKEIGKPIDEEFDTLKEDWSIYQLEDGTTLKFKIVLIRVIRELDDKGNPIYNFSMRNVFVARVPPSLKGTLSKTKYSMEELDGSIVKEDMKFEAKKEDWNTYKLKSGAIIELKPILTMISRTDKFDERGDPIYFIQSHVVPRGKISKEVKDKLLVEAKRSAGE